MIDDIEDKMGKSQFAYKRLSGTKNCCKALNDIIKSRKKCLVIKTDFVSAFNKLERHSMFDVIFKKLKN
jgi:hypothetical protein